MQHQEDGGQPSPRHFVYLVYPTSRCTLLHALTIPHVFPDLMDGLATGLKCVPQEAHMERAREGCAAAWDTVVGAGMHRNGVGKGGQGAGREVDTGQQRVG